LPSVVELLLLFYAKLKCLHLQKKQKKTIMHVGAHLVYKYII